MTEEFDEDVVFENSPLFRYLHDLGHTDFETCPTAARDQDGDLASGDVPRKAQEGVMQTLAELVWKWNPLQKVSSSHTLEQQLDSTLGEYSVRCILDQDVLLQEDVELIELLEPGLLTLRSSPDRTSAAALPRPAVFATPSAWDLAGLMGLAAVLLGLCSASGGAWSLAAAPLVLATLCWAAALWRRGSAQRAVHARVSQLRALIHNSKTLTGMSRKALRLVQETEVISRGFTLLLDRVSAAGTFSRAGLGALAPRGQQLIGLRKALYRALRSGFRASRRATCHMLKEFPLSSEVDNVTNYVSAVPLKELGLGLGLEHLGDEQAQELTDDYSLPALKMLFQLWVGQSSECFRRLALLMSPRRLEEEGKEGLVPKEGSSTPPLAAPLHRSIGGVTEPLHHALAACLAEVRRSYDFHRHFETQARTSGSDRGDRVQEKCRELNTLHTSIRSLQLHLKALLSEMIIMEDDLEKLMVSKEPGELTLEGYRDLSDRLSQLRPHMQASAGCWDDTVVQVERMLRRANDCPGNIEGPDQCGTPMSEMPDPPPSYPLILDRDPVPEELEFEAYVSESDSEDKGKDSWCDMLTPEERERQRREREESRRVLSELKAVLGVRTSEGERMKRKQMLFSDRAASICCSDAATDPSAAPAASAERGHKLSELAAGNEEGEREGKEQRLSPDPSEFSCGLEAEEEASGSSACGPGAGGGASELHQYDGEDNLDGLDGFLNPGVPAVSIMDRLKEIHSSESLSFSSAVAAQVAARSHSLVKMEEQTFGDEEDEGSEEEH
ncbi:vezatin isoform X1 [Hippocampus zosterae]|uniref:vezatin isoform X1 n=1 Tax=Hippocampus zosterae TaxID=109293 RepID=UPI00223E413B|nr:vezatin isoform X1 [Hippocampus zosterae]